MNETGQSQFNQARIEWAIRLRYSPMPELDMKFLARQLNALRIGDLREVGKTWEIMMERDAELAVNADKRCSDLAGLDYSIVSDGSPDGDKHAEALTYFYKHLKATSALEQDEVGGVPALLYHMASAISYRYSVHEMLMRPDNSGQNEVTAEFRHTPIWFFESRRGYLGYMPQIFDLYGQPCIQGEWLTCVGNGWMRPLCMAYAMKHFPLRDWLQWCSRYGSGFLEAISDATKGTPEWNEGVATLETLMNDGAVMHSSGIQLKFLEQSARGAQNPFEGLVERVDRLYAKCYRGVDLATGSRMGNSGGQSGQGGSGSGKSPVGASVQKEESGIFLARDASWATGYLNERVDRPVIRYLFNQEPRAAIVINTPTEDTSTEDLASMSALVPLGLRISMAEAYKKFGWKIPAAGEPCLTAPVQPAPQNPEDGSQKTESGNPNPNPARKPNPAVVAPKPGEGGPSGTDEAAAVTQTAQESEDTPIGAGAQPGAMQTADNRMPDPVVDSAGFWSTIGATARAIFGPFGSDRNRNLNPNRQLPALAAAIPNDQPQEVSDELETAARELYAKLIHEDMAHAAKRVTQFLETINDDPEHAKILAPAFLEEWKSITANTVAAPKSAQALQSVLGTAFAIGKGGIKK